MNEINNNDDNDNNNDIYEFNDLFEISFIVNNNNELDMRINWHDDFYMYQKLPRNIAILLHAVSHGQFADRIKEIFINKAKNDDYLEFIKEIFIQLESIAEDRIEDIKNNPVIQSAEVLKGLPPI